MSARGDQLPVGRSRVPGAADLGARGTLTASTADRCTGVYHLFELINLAEERERVRTSRTESHEGTLEDSLETAAGELGERDVDVVRQVVEDVLIEPNFTVHPTEARRKTVKSKLRPISTHLETLDERLLTEKEKQQVWRDIGAEVTSLWQTPQVRNRQPEPEDEARNVQWYLENTLFDVVVEVYDELAAAIDDSVDGGLELPKLFESRSWGRQRPRRKSVRHPRGHRQHFRAPA